MKIPTNLVGAILGVAPYMKRDDVTRRLVREHHNAESETSDNVATAWGRANTEGAMIEFTMETGIEPTPLLLGNNLFTPSNIIGASTGGIIVIRCPYSQRKAAKPEFKTAKEQPHYYANMQIEMALADAYACYFYQWAPQGSKLEIVKRDNDFIDDATDVIVDYIYALMQEIDNPDHLAPLRQTIDTPDAVKLVNEYDELGDALDRAKQRQSEIMDALVLLADGKNAIVAGRNLTRMERAGSVSYAKAIKELAPDADLEKYLGKASEFWRLF